MKEILHTKVIDSLISLKACEPRCLPTLITLSIVINVLALHIIKDLTPLKVT
jgi:hypothetical protein